MILYFLGWCFKRNKIKIKYKKNKTKRQQTTIKRGSSNTNIIFVRWCANYDEAEEEVVDNNDEEENRNDDNDDVVWPSTRNASTFLQQKKHKITKNKG